jgi:hypothetical protein
MMRLLLLSLPSLLVQGPLPPHHPQTGCASQCHRLAGTRGLERGEDDFCVSDGSHSRVLS